MKRVRNRVCVVGFTFFVLIAGHALGAEETKEKSEEKVTLSGIFEATKSIEVKFDTNQLAGVEIRKVVDHGSEVKQGDFLISFERDGYKEQLDEANRKMASSEVSRKEAQFQHEQFLATQKLDKQSANRAWEAAEEEYQGYLEFDRQYAIDSAKFSLKQSRNSLEYLQEDLRQLERMYEEDELTEESEELVLVRARRAIESSKFRLRGTEVRTERALKQTLPKQEEDQKEKYHRAKLAYEKSMADLEFAAKKKKLSVDAASIAFDEEKEKLEELKSDRAKLMIKAPSDGIVFYGKLNRGQMSDKPTSLESGAKVTKDQVFLTIVSPKRMQVRTTLSEKDIANVKVGMRGKAKPSARPDEALNVVVQSVGRVPFAKGKFDCVLDVKGKTQDLLPTMSCSVEFDLAETDASEETVAGKGSDKKKNARPRQPKKIMQQKQKKSEQPKKPRQQKKTKKSKEQELKKAKSAKKKPVNKKPAKKASQDSATVTGTR